MKYVEPTLILVIGVIAAAGSIVVAPIVILIIAVQAAHSATRGK
tara:strand:- start:23 stop:154 length:132 start_codon:yes stop_codon:yes gene_type:complete